MSHVLLADALVGSLLAVWGTHTRRAEGVVLLLWTGLGDVLRLSRCLIRVSCAARPLLADAVMGLLFEGRITHDVLSEL